MKKMKRKLLTDHRDIQTLRLNKMERELRKIEQEKEMQSKWPKWVKEFFHTRFMRPDVDQPTPESILKDSSVSTGV